MGRYCVLDQIKIVQFIVDAYDYKEETEFGGGGFVLVWLDWVDLNQKQFYMQTMLSYLTFPPLIQEVVILLLNL